MRSTTTADNNAMHLDRNSRPRRAELEAGVYAGLVLASAKASLDLQEIIVSSTDSEELPPSYGQKEHGEQELEQDGGKTWRRSNAMSASNTRSTSSASSLSTSSFSTPREVRFRLLLQLRECVFVEQKKKRMRCMAYRNINISSAVQLCYVRRYIITVLL